MVHSAGAVFGTIPPFIALRHSILLIFSHFLVFELYCHCWPPMRQSLPPFGGSFAHWEGPLKVLLSDEKAQLLVASKMDLSSHSALGHRAFTIIVSPMKSCQG